MKLTVNKRALGKIAAYGTGAMVGGGLTWLGWRWLEKRGIDPIGFIRKKAVEGDREYYDPANDPDLDIDALVPGEIDDGMIGMEDGDGRTDEDEDEEDEPPVVRHVTSREPYMIDAETCFHSEEEGYRHEFLKFYTLDGQTTDSNGEILPEEPWKVIGISNYEYLAGDDSESEIYVRDEANKTDYVISKEEGCLND